TFTEDAIRDSTTVTVINSQKKTLSMTKSWLDFTLTLSYAQSFSTADTITVTVDVADVYSNRQQYSWQFFIKSDFTPPYFDVFVPGHQHLMGTKDPISLIFPGDIDKTSVNALLVGSISGNIAGNRAWSDTTYVITPDEYALGETLTLTVSASDIHNNAISDTTIVFTVKPEEIPPSVISRIPTAGKLNVPTVSNIIITFDSEVTPDSTTVNVIGSNQRTITMDKSWETGAVTLINNYSFQQNETIKVSVDAGDLYSNRAYTEWFFSTGSKLDIAYYSITTSGDPDLMGKLDTITVSFFTTVDTTTVDISLVGSKSGVVSGTWSQSDYDYTFTPSVGYTNGETLLLTINAADIYGNTLPESSRNFTVGEHTPWLLITSVELADSTLRKHRINYTFGDPDSSYTVTRGWQYSLDGGQWVDIPESHISENNIQPPGSNFIYWNMPDTFIGVYSTNVRFRMEVFDGRFSSGNQISPPFSVDFNQMPAVTIQDVTVDYNSWKIAVSYSIEDVEKNPVTLLFEYSKDGGSTWTTGTPLTDLSNIPSGQYDGSFEWNYLEGLTGGIDYFVFRIRLTPFDFKKGTPDETENLNIDLNEPPSVQLDDLYSPQSGDLTIQYHIADAENDTIRFVCSYSIDDGNTWIETIHVSGVDSIQTYDGSFVWHSKFDEPTIKSFTVKFRVVPWDHDEGISTENEIFQLINNGPPDIEASLPDTVSGQILIPFLITDLEKDPVSVHVMWAHGDGKLRPATVIGDTLDIEESAYQDTLEWDSKVDAGEGFFQDLQLRLAVSDESNPLSSTVVNFMDFSLILDNEPPKFERAWGFAHGDTIYFDFNESVIDSLVLKPETYSLSHNLSVQTVQRGNVNYQYFLLLDGGQTLPNEIISISKTDITDIFGNSAKEVSITFSPEDDNENPNVSIFDLLDEVSGAVAVNYQISDTEKDLVSLSVYYSIDGGHTWEIPSVLGNLTDIGVDNYGGSFIWKTLDDLPGAVIEDVQLKVIPKDSQEGVPAYSNLFSINNNYRPSVSLSVADPDSLYSGTIELFYELSDSESDTLSISALYSLDDGNTYTQATVEGTPDNITSENFTGTLLWDTIADLPDSFRTVIFKAIPYDKREGIPDSLSVLIDNYGTSRVSVILPEGEQTGEITVTYTITDPNDRNVSLAFEYSTDNQKTWHSADIEGEITQLAPENYQGSFIWKSKSQLDGFEGTAFVRITPDNGKEGLSDIDEVYLDYNVAPEITVEPVTGEISGDVTFQYRASDTEQDKVNISFNYSIDDRKNWLEAETSGDKSDVVADGSDYSIVWHTAEDLPGKD
ncbi:Ig-like domain-containing protein, partial [Candidatus Latescibacterota bacterium]